MEIGAVLFEKFIQDVLPNAFYPFIFVFINTTPTFYFSFLDHTQLFYFNLFPIVFDGYPE